MPNTQLSPAMQRAAAAALAALEGGAEPDLEAIDAILAGLPPPTPAPARRPTIGPRPTMPSERVADVLSPALGRHTAGRLGEAVGLVGDLPYAGGRAMAEGVATGNPSQVARGAAMALPVPAVARVPMGARRRLLDALTGPMRQVSGVDPDFGYLARQINQRMPGAPPPGGAWPWGVAGATAGGAAGYGASEGDPLATLGGAVAGGALGYGGARAIGGRMRWPGPTGRSRTPDTGPSREAARFIREMPNTGRSPTGGGPFASYEEQRRAVSDYIRAGNPPPVPTRDSPWGVTPEARDQFIRDALAWYRAQRR